MIRRAMLGLVLLVIGLPACSDPSGKYSPEMTHRSVQSLSKGLYVVDYKWPYVVETFGKDQTIAVPTYLEAKGLIPAECVRGVTVVRGGRTEGGWAWAEFRCK